MIREHKSSVAIFFGIYLAVSLIVGAAVYGLYRSSDFERKKAVSEGVEITSRDKLIPKPGDAQKRAMEKEKMPTTFSEKVISAPATKEKAVPKPPKKSVEKSVEKPPEKQKNADNAIDEEIAKMFPMPAIKPLIEIVGNWNAVPKRAYPSFVTIHTPVDFKVRQGSVVVAEGKIPAGSSLIPVQLDGVTLTLSSSPNSNMRVTLPVDETDFKQKIEAKYNDFVSKQEGAVMARRIAEKKRRGLAEVKETKLSAYNDGKDSRFDPLKASIRRGEAGFFQMESARKWRWAGTESIEGENFDVAFVMMISESAFGTSERELKALIQDEKVVSWIDVTTGEKL